MKTIFSFLAAAALTGLTTGQAHAGSCNGYRVQTVSQCVYKTHTCEVSRCRHKKMGYDQCGRCYYYWVTVVTYRDSYSNGTSRTYQLSYKG